MKIIQRTWVFVKGVLLYSLVGLSISGISILWIELGLVNVVTQFLGRRPGNILGIIGSFFVHKDWNHLYNNLLPYIIFSTLIFIYSNPLKGNSYFLSDWKKWSLIQLFMMFVIGFWDSYSTIAKPSIGMSDLVSAVAVGALAAIYKALPEYLKFDSECKRMLKLLLCIVFILFISYTIIESNKYSMYLQRVNIIAHVKGIVVGSLTFFLTVFLINKKLLATTLFSANVVIVLFLIYLSILLRI